MSNTTELQQMYDTAYEQGFRHAIEVAKMCLKVEQPYTSYAIDKMELFIKEKYGQIPETNTGQVNQPAG